MLRKKLIHLLFFDPAKDNPTIKVFLYQKQEGGNDCGLFAIAAATAIANGHDPSKMKFQQGSMRPHFISCIKNNRLQMFPTL